MGLELPPTWGPIGSLLQREDPVRYEQVLRAHEAMLAQERERRESVTRTVTRNCVGCGASFEPARANHRYCSNGCRQQGFRNAKSVTRVVA
jgi:hypothetical protein